MPGDKGDPDWQHIPVILLTARTDAVSGVKGWNTGADAYISKPFDPDYLKAAVDGLIKNRKRVQDKILNFTATTLKESVEKEEDNGLSKVEQDFLSHIYELLNKNIENVNFNVASLAEELNMSFSNLRLKIKTLTGESPLAFVKTYRMNTAMQLQIDGYQVSEVSYTENTSRN